MGRGGKGESILPAVVKRERERGGERERDVVLHNAAHSCARIARSGTIDGKVTKREGGKEGNKDGRRMARRVAPK